MNWVCWKCQRYGLGVAPEHPYLKGKKCLEKLANGGSSQPCGVSEVATVRKGNIGGMPKRPIAIINRNNSLASSTIAWVGKRSIGG